MRRYRAALDHFLEFVNTRPNLHNIDQVKESTVEEFVRYLRRKERVLSEERTGTRDRYKWYCAYPVYLPHAVQLCL